MINELLKKYPKIRSLIERGVLEIAPYKDRSAIFVRPDLLQIAKEREPLFVIESEGHLSAKSFGLSIYPSRHMRREYKDRNGTDMGANDGGQAYIFLCNRFIKSTGHTFLYIYFPDNPELSRLVEFNAFASRLDFVQKTEDRRAVLILDNTSTKLKEFTISSAVGYPVSGNQARMLLADVFLDCHLGVDYQLLNLGGGKGRFNCAGWAVNAMSDIGINAAKLRASQAHHHYSEGKLPEFLLTIPPALSYEIRMAFREFETQQTKGRIISEGSGISCPFIKRDDGIIVMKSVLGHTAEDMVSKRFFPGPSKYLNIDIRDALEALRLEGLFAKNFLATGSLDIIANLRHLETPNCHLASSR